MARTVAQILTSMRDSLVGTALSAFSPYSNIHILYRAVAIAIAEQDSLLEGMLSGFHLGTATGIDLDRRAEDYGLTRLLGMGAQGWVLAKSTEGVLLQQGTLLTDPTSRYQYEVGERGVYVGVGVEVPVYVRSTTGSSSSNLPPGTYLTSSFYPSITFTVGRYRNAGSNSTPVGGIEGGTDRESDVSLRERLLQHLRNRGTSNRDSIYLAVRAIPGITRVVLVEHDPITGYFTVYVNTNDSTLLTQVRGVVDSVKAAGVSYLVRPMLSTPVNLDLSVSTTRDIDTDALRSALVALIEGTLPSAPLLADRIKAVVMAAPGVDRVISLTPNTDILIPAGQGQVLVAGTIKITTSGA